MSSHSLPPGDVCPALFPLFISPASLTLMGNEQSSVKDASFELGRSLPHFLNSPFPEAVEMVVFSPNCRGRWVLIYNNNKYHQIFTFGDLENYPKLGNKGKSMNFQYHTETSFQRPTPKDPLILWENVLVFDFAIHSRLDPKYCGVTCSLALFVQPIGRKRTSMVWFYCRKYTFNQFCI